MAGTPDLTVRLGALTLPSPVLLAAGCWGYGENRDPAVYAGVGALVVKTTTLKPRAGFPPPRMVETPSGMLNAIGLENPGIEAVVREKLPALRDFPVPVILSIAGETVDEYAQLARRAAESPVPVALELNISCPNTDSGGLEFTCDPAASAAVVRAVRPVWQRPLLVKLGPVTNIAAVAKACEEAGADALTAVNTFRGMVIDTDTRQPAVSAGAGGLSGPAIRPLAVWCVHQGAQAVGIPVIGVGGISSGRDALEFLLAGAAAVQVGTAGLLDPLAAARIARELLEALVRQNVEDIAAVKGAARPKPA